MRSSLIIAVIAGFIFVMISNAFANNNERPTSKATPTHPTESLLNDESRVRILKLENECIPQFKGDPTKLRECLIKGFKNSGLIVESFSDSPPQANPPEKKK